MDVFTSVFGETPVWIRQFQSGILPFFPIVYTEASDTFRQNTEVQPILFDQGRLLFDRFTISNASFSDESVLWAHQSDRGFTSGNLTYAKSGTELHGTVSLGNDAATAREYLVFATAFPLSEYTSKVSWEGPQGAVTIADDGPLFRIGVRGEQGMAPTISVFVDETDLSESICQSLDPSTGRAVLDILLPERGEGSLISGTARIVFEVGDNGECFFTGAVTRIDGDGSIWEGQWTGQRRTPLQVENALIEEQTPPLAFVDAVLPSGESSLSEAELASPEVERAILSLLGKAPEDSEISRQTPSYMAENMKYAMWLDPSNDEVTSRRKWMEKFFKEQRPTIQDPVRVASITSTADWYRNTMATAIFGNCLTQQTFDNKVMPRPLDEGRKKIIKEYVEKCLAQEGTYTEQQNVLWRTVYFDRAPSLKTYRDEDRAKLDARVDKTQTPSEWQNMTWAERLLDYATAPQQFQVITDNLMGGSTGGTSSQTTGSTPEQKITAAKDKLAEFEKKLTERRERLSKLEAQQPPDMDMISIIKEAVEALESSIAAQKETITTLEEQKADREKKSLLTMRRISSLLYAFDASGNLSKSYMDGVGMAYVSRSAENANIHLIQDYESTLTDYLTAYFDDLANNRIKVFAQVDEADDLKELLRTEAMNTRRLASQITQSLSNARKPTFLESSQSATETFSQQYPKLTGVFRIALIAAYVFTVLKVLEVVQQGTGSASTVETVATYGAFAALTMETIRSLAVNAKHLFRGIFTSGRSVPVVPEAATQPGRFVQFFKSIGSGIAKAAMWMVNGVRSLGVKVGEAIVKNKVYLAIRGVFSSLFGRIASVAKSIASSVGGWVDAIRQSPKWTKLANFVGKAFGVLVKGFMVIGSIWVTVSEGLNLISTWNTLQSGWHKALATLQLVTLAVSTIAGIVGLASSMVIWSGAGAILALAAVGIGLLINYLWPPESTLQKIMTEVVVPFVDNTAKPAVDKLSPTPGAASTAQAEVDFSFTSELAFA